MLCHPEPGSAVSYALRNAKSPNDPRHAIVVFLGHEPMIPRVAGLSP